MYFECTKCNRQFEELEQLGKVKHCGDHWKCTDCDHDITKDLDTWFKEVNGFADVIWNAGNSESPSEEMMDAWKVD